jgi:sister chromatid cohesion protein DCC1
MKGTPQDDAVICTQDHTFTLRTITVSNSIIFLRPEPASSTDTTIPTAGDLYIQDTCHEILELTPSVPRLARVEKLLKPSAWEGMGRGTKRSRDDGNVDGGKAEGKKVKRYTREQMQSIVQASDGELDAGLRERNVIVVDGTFPPLPTNLL